MLYVYSPDVDPTSPEFDTEDQTQLNGREGTMVDLINRCMHEEMERNPRIVVLGEDVADASRAEYLSRVKGKGGVFMVTDNLQRRIGGDRVYETQLDEPTDIGSSLEMVTG